MTNNIFQLRIHNSQIVKKEGSYQTFDVSKKCFFHTPIHREDVLLQDKGIKQERRSEMQETGDPNKERPSRW